MSLVTGATSRVRQEAVPGQGVEGQELCPQSQCPFSWLGQTEIGLKAHSPSGLISLPSHNVLFPPQHQGICFILGFKSLQPLLKDKGAQHSTVIFFFVLSIAIKEQKAAQGNKARQVKHPPSHKSHPENQQSSPQGNNPPIPAVSFPSLRT